MYWIRTHRRIMVYKLVGKFMVLLLAFSKSCFYIFFVVKKQYLLLLHKLCMYLMHTLQRHDEERTYLIYTMPICILKKTLFQLYPLYLRQKYWGSNVVWVALKKNGTAVLSAVLFRLTWRGGTRRGTAVPPDILCVLLTSPTSRRAGWL